MLAIIISLGIGAAVGIIFFWNGFGSAVYITVGFIVFAACQIGTGLLMRKLVKKYTNEIQAVIQGAQTKLNKKIQFFQQKPQGGIKNMQKILEKDQHVFIRQAIEETKRFEKLYSWNLMLPKQVNTMRMQFYFQLKEFNKVDELMSKSVFMDPMSVAMKMVRLYKKGDTSYKQLFRKKAKKFAKNENGALLYALYSWILVKNGQIEEAIKVLQQGKDKTKNEVIEQNLEALVNGKEKRFSNADFGDIWYSLFLEEPKIPKPKQQMVYR
ncbi:MAG TPA: hypothetical protein DD381_14040 [Lentisphaeria bacterium]|nr:MAG: hypothetical protein A2X47_01225 [Lentisphaerae bacterium GWF2_38_69]HBM17444.1 hypothetical protein [Lentisphaeria bacterium]